MLETQRTDRDLGVFYSVDVRYKRIRCFERVHFIKPTLPGEIQVVGFFYKVFNIQIYFFLKTDWGQPGVSVILRSKQIISRGITTSAVSSLLFHCLLHNWRILTSHQASLIIINPPIRLTIKGAIWLVKVCPRSLMKRRTQTNSSRLTARQSKHLETGFLTHEDLECTLHILHINLEFILCLNSEPHLDFMGSSRRVKIMAVSAIKTSLLETLITDASRN